MAELANRRAPSRPRLHPLELLTPVVLLAILGLFALPNYFDFRPQADLEKAVEEIQKLVLTARKASLTSPEAGVRFEPSEDSAQLWVRKDDAAGAQNQAHYLLPGTVSFGYGKEQSPFPSLVLEDGTNLAATDDGITFEGDALAFRGGLLEGFPGLIYLNNSRGDHLALYVRISGEVQVHEWDGRHWRQRADLVRWTPAR